MRNFPARADLGNSPITFFQECPYCVRFTSHAQINYIIQLKMCISTFTGVDGFTFAFKTLQIMISTANLFVGGTISFTACQLLAQICISGQGNVVLQSALFLIFQVYFNMPHCTVLYVFFIKCTHLSICRFFLLFLLLFICSW